jgi:hypothetical protein
VSTAKIPANLRREVWSRAKGRCEYCLLRDQDGLLPHEPDHVIATQHGGKSTLENLALACFDCNRLKGPNIASIDPDTGRPEYLFNPRSDNWETHFRMKGAEIIPLTAKGRATAALLRFNASERRLVREALL